MKRNMKNQKMGRLSEQKYMSVLFLLCWVVYCTSYVGRLNYSSVISVMISDEVLDASGAGFISMIYFLAYGVGQMVNGFIGDYVNPKRMIFCGLFFSGVSNMAMAVSRHFGVMTVIWGLNGYFQAMIWAPIIRIFAEMIDQKNRINSSVNIVTSQLIGTLLAYIMSAGVLKFSKWETVFTLAAVLLVVVSIIWEIGFSKICDHTQEKGEKKSEKEDILQKEQNSTVKTILISSGAVFMFFHRTRNA